jgi:hypothetical protein
MIDKIYQFNNFATQIMLKILEITIINSKPVLSKKVLLSIKVTYSFIIIQMVLRLHKDFISFIISLKLSIK